MFWGNYSFAIVVYGVPPDSFNIPILETPQPYSNQGVSWWRIDELLKQSELDFVNVPLRKTDLPLRVLQGFPGLYKACEFTRDMLWLDGA